MVKCTSLDSLIVYCDIIIIIIMDLNKVKQVEFSRRMAAEMLTYFFSITMSSTKLLCFVHNWPVASDEMGKNVLPKWKGGGA